MRHLISLDDLTDDDLNHLIERGARHARGERDRAALAGKVVALYFARTSTRTRTAFSAGAVRLGAALITYGPNDLQMNTGETSEDTGRMLSGMVDAVVARTAANPAELRCWSRNDGMAVVNAMTEDEHPTQAIADLTTLWLRFDRIDGLRVLYVGEGNNTAAALALGLTRFTGVHLELRTPQGYGLATDVLCRAQATAARTGASITERHDMRDIPTGFDVVYTTRWQTTGTAKPDPQWRTVFEPFQVTDALWENNSSAVLMHDLPAHRGEEITAELLDGPRSIAFDQATTKLHSAMAVLTWALG